MTIPEIVDELRKLNVPENLLEPIITYHKQSICPHDNIKSPKYSAETWFDRSLLIKPPECKDCGKTFNLNEVITTERKTVLR